MATNIRDLIYFDFDKAASLWSQLEGGLRSERSVTETREAGASLGARAGIANLIKIEAGASGKGTTAAMEKQALHHDLLNYLEGGLRSRHLLTDLSQNLPGGSTIDASSIRMCLADRPYIDCEGWAAIENYEEFLRVLSKFNDLASFVHWSALQSNLEYRELLTSLSQAQGSIEAEVDRTKRRDAERLKRQIDDMKKKLEAVPDAIEKRVQDGIDLWLRMFAPNRLSLRLIPVESAPDFQVVCNLNRKYFLDDNFEHVINNYGRYPAVRLGVLGLITALPSSDAEKNPQDRFLPTAREHGSDTMQVAFQTMLVMLEGLNRFSQPYRYPSIGVQPIAVFRHFSS